MIDFMCGPPFFKRLGKSHKRKHNECSLKDITVGYGDARPAMSSSALRMSVKGHSLPRHRAPAPTNVRYASNSEKI